MRARIHAIFATVAFVLMMAGGTAAQAQYWQCAPFARVHSGIQLFGNAGGWWAQAEGKYQRGSTPAQGAVMVFKAIPSMRVGHVATVSEIVDARTLKITHANWSPINGTRGQVETDVTVIDTSAANDWSQVRVWYAPIKGMGLRNYPLHGFIYKDEAKPAAEPKLEFAGLDLAS